MTVADLEFPHRLVILDRGHWERVVVHATAPLTRDGIGAFIRYEDQVATRFGYVVSRWGTEDASGVFAGVMVFGVEATASGVAPRDHPSNDRRFRTILIEATARPEGSARPVPARPPAPLLWARSKPEEPLVPVEFGDDGATVDVAIRGPGLSRPRQDLLLTSGEALRRLAHSPAPVDVPVYGYTHRTREKVESRVAAGRARPAATWTVGTLEQFAAAGSHR